MKVPQALALIVLLCASGLASAQEPPVPQAAGTAAALDRASLSYSNKWRITFNHEADTSGTLVFRMVMKNSDADPVVLAIPIEKGTGENAVAGKVKGALQSAFPRAFNVETDDGESVLVKLGAREGQSSVVLLSSDVAGLKTRIRKE